MRPARSVRKHNRRPVTVHFVKQLEAADWGGGEKLLFGAGRFRRCQERSAPGGGGDLQEMATFDAHAASNSFQLVTLKAVVLS
jgi:hypothetical protein